MRARAGQCLGGCLRALGTAWAPWTGLCLRGGSASALPLCLPSARRPPAAGQGPRPKAKAQGHQGHQGHRATGVAIIDLQQGIPSKRESSARVDYVPALCTHRPSLLPIEWSGEALGSRRRGRSPARDVARSPLNLII